MWLAFSFIFCIARLIQDRSEVKDSLFWTSKHNLLLAQSNFRSFLITKTALFCTWPNQLVYCKVRRIINSTGHNNFTENFKIFKYLMTEILYTINTYNKINIINSIFVDKKFWKSKSKVVTCVLLLFKLSGPRICQTSCWITDVWKSFHLSEVTPTGPQDEDMNFCFCDLMFRTFFTLGGRP